MKMHVPTQVRYTFIHKAHGKTAHASNWWWLTQIKTCKHSRRSLCASVSLINMHARTRTNDRTHTILVHLSKQMLWAWPSAFTECMPLLLKDMCVYVAAKCVRVCVCVEKREGEMKWMQSEDKRKNQQRAGEWQEERDGERERETH